MEHRLKVAALVAVQNFAVQRRITEPLHIFRIAESIEHIFVKFFEPVQEILPAGFLIKHQCRQRRFALTPPRLEGNRR